MYLDELLKVYWLRPETALWRSIDIDAMSEFEFRSPSLDLGCGDGVFSFLRAGGQFDMTFDVYKSLNNIEKYFKNADVYDSYNPSLKPAIIKQPGYKIDFGFDQKENLLNKAKSLGLYRNCVVGDANERLPFSDGTFQSIFSNIVYWLDEPKFVLGEISRILKPGGNCCLMLPDRKLAEYSFYYSLFYSPKNEDFRFLENLDRGRLQESIKVIRNEVEWIDLLQDSGLQIVSHKRHLSKPVIQMWDIGLRPLFPVLAKMIQKLEPNDVVSIKMEWIEILKHFLAPIAEMDKKLSARDDMAFHCFILRK